MPMDYRVDLDCGHTLNYRTTVHPMERARLACVHCGPDQRALRATRLSAKARLFHRFAGTRPAASRAAAAVEEPVEVG